MKATKAQANATKTAKKKNGSGESTKALSLVLDFKQSHRIRQRAADSAKVDLFALHAFKKGSRGYVALCADNAQRVIDANKGRDATHVLVAGAVANKITVGADGFYSRVHGNGFLVGNVNALTKLYGKDVEAFAVGEMETRFNAIREQVTRRIGSGKNAREIVGREFAVSGDKFAMFGAERVNGRIVIFNGEFKRNVHNYSVRAVTVKTTTAKDANKGATQAQKDAEKAATKG